MATLKSLKNKYLTVSDGTVLGVTTNTENISALSFKLATADSLSKFNLVDGFTDDYNDATGVDASGSTNETRNASNYYSGIAPGGTLFTTTFTTSTTWVATTTSLEVLVVAGGGQGGMGGTGGGGGGGGLEYLNGKTVVYGTPYTVTVGVGGSTATSGVGQNGTNSVFYDMIAVGGGGGGQGNDEAADGGNGGGGTPEVAGPQDGGSGYQTGTGGAPHFGEPGGDGYTGSGVNDQSGGGGGSGGAGVPGVSNDPGDGGTGRNYSISGGGIWYSSGGGGGTRSAGTGAVGGAGGATGGGTSSNGQDGDVNKGMGGGGGGSGTTGGDGGSGVVIIKGTTTDAYLNMTLISNAYTAQSAPTTARIILDEQDVGSSTTVNTDIKAYASRDNGTTFTQITLADQGFLLPNPGNDEFTRLMLHCDGSNSGTTFTDTSDEAHTVTANGGAITSTTQKKFGTASMYTSGNSDFLSIPNSADFNFGNGDFTIDAWIYHTGTTGYQTIATGTNTAHSTYWQFRYFGADGRFDFWVTGDTNGVTFAPGSQLTVNTWNHLAISRNGNNWYGFVNGAKIGATQVNSFTITDVDGLLEIGGPSWLGQPFIGYIDEFRISKGIARWTATFTPPGGPYNDNSRLLSGSVDISGQPSGTNIKYKIETLNQAVGKQTRVYGTSMAWA